MVFPLCMSTRKTLWNPQLRTGVKNGSVKLESLTFNTSIKQGMEQVAQTSGITKMTRRLSFYGTVPVLSNVTPEFRICVCTSFSNLQINKYFNFFYVTRILITFYIINHKMYAFWVLRKYIFLRDRRSLIWWKIPGLSNVSQWSQNLELYERQKNNRFSGEYVAIF